MTIVSWREALKMKFRCAFIMIVVALLSVEICFAKTPPKKVSLENLEGRWEVVSTTWGGDPDDFLQGIYQFKIIKSPTKTKSDHVQFIVLVDSENTVKNFDNTPFCGTRYENFHDNLTLYNGYQYLDFWKLPEYPCGVLEEFSDMNSDKNDPNVYFNGTKFLLRFKIINPEKLSVIVYYEIGVGVAAIESSVSEKDKKDDAAKCENGICIAQPVIGTGIFELTLKKIGKWKEMTGTKRSKIGIF
jgi:hypothetical protein